MTRTGGQLVVDTLRRHGVDQVFLVPGESYLPVLDALYDAPEITLTVCRQEGGAAMMAEAYGKLTGRPGVCLVTRGPGATNASAGVHIARQDSTPLILLIGQVSTAMQEREAFQEIDYRQMYGPLSKWVAQIDRPERVAELLGRAFYTATAGRPGPVVLALPEDMLSAETEPQPARMPVPPVVAHPDPSQIDQIREYVLSAHRPLVLIGGPGWSEAAVADLVRFAAAWQIPVAAGFRRQDGFPSDHPSYAGDVGLGINPALRQRIQNADVLLVIGARLTEVETGGYTLLTELTQTLIHVFPDPEELGRVYPPDLAINAAVAPCVRALATLAPPAEPLWAAHTQAAHTEYLAWSTPQPLATAVDMGAIITHLRTHLPPDTVITNGAGNYAIWLHRFYRYRDYGTQLAPQSGSMGYGLPAAIAAKRVHPQRPVVCLAGDGCFLMTGQELATAVQYQLPIVIIVVNNSQYGTIRMHQERQFPGRVIGTGLRNPDFTALARAYGAWAACVTATAAFADALAQALAQSGPALLELKLDPRVLSPNQILPSATP